MISQEKCPDFFLGYLAKDNPRLINSDYIYLISYKNAKRQTLLKGFALLKNDITGSEPAFGIANIVE